MQTVTHKQMPKVQNKPVLSPQHDLNSFHLTETGFI